MTGFYGSRGGEGPVADSVPMNDAPDQWGDSPGRFPPYDTVEIDPHTIGPVHTEYAPKHDGLPDPGEIVWTWVPYEEHDGRGKDRPVLLVAREHNSEHTLL